MTKMPPLLPEHARPPSCIMCKDKNAVPARRQCALEVLVLLHKPPSSIMCRDKAAVVATGACILEVGPATQNTMLHHAHGQTRCPCYRSMHSGRVGPHTRTTIMHHVHGQKRGPCYNSMHSGSVGPAAQTNPAPCAGTKLLSLFQEHALWDCWSCYTDHNAASCVVTKKLSLLQEHALWTCWSC